MSVSKLIGTGKLIIIIATRKMVYGHLFLEFGDNKNKPKYFLYSMHWDTTKSDRKEIPRSVVRVHLDCFGYSIFITNSSLDCISFKIHCIFKLILKSRI